MYKSLALVDQNDLEFLVPSDSDNYVRGKLVSGAGEDVDLTDTKELAKKTPPLTVQLVERHTQRRRRHAFERPL